MQILKTTLLAGVLAFNAASAFAITIETGGNIIASPTNFNGFEEYGNKLSVSGNPFISSYSEGGITVALTSINVPVEPIGGYSYWNGMGQYQWYVPDPGFTDIRLSNGGNFLALQFLASSGLLGVSSAFLEYQLLERGALIAGGTLRINAACCAPGSWDSVGFGGGGFDEVRLQATEQFLDFNRTGMQALALDNISAVGEVPLPGALPLFATGLGLLGLLGWRRKRKSAAAIA